MLPTRKDNNAIVRHTVNGMSIDAARENVKKPTEEGSIRPAAVAAVLPQSLRHAKYTKKTHAVAPKAEGNLAFGPITR